MGRIKIDYGIDLGTTNSALSRMENGEVVTIEIDQSRIVPSCVYIDKRGRNRVGIQAFRKYPNFLEFKRDMGLTTEYDTLDGNKTNPEKLSAELLKKLASEITDEVFKSVVITVPAAFILPQVSATKRAAELAGFEHVEILMEPVAAAFKYGLEHKVKDAKFVVFDFGGGTFDAALVTSPGGVMQVKSCEGDNNLGGGDIDKAIVNEIFLPELKENYSISELELLDKKDGIYWRQVLKNYAVILKKELGKKEECILEVDVDELPEDDEGEEMEIDLTVTREQLNKLARPLFQRAIDLTKKLLKNNELSTSDLSALVLVGGPTQMPILREMIEEQLMKPDISINPMTGIAEGAALYASTMQNNVKKHGTGPNAEANSNEPVIELEVDYRSLTNKLKEPVSVIVKGTSEPLFGEIIREDGLKTEKAALDAVFMVDIDLKKCNNFTINVFNEKNDRVTCSPNKFPITPGIEGGTGVSALPKYIGMDYQAKNGKILYTAFRGLEKDTPMPAVGKSTLELFTQNELRPGNTDDTLVISIFQAESGADGSRSLVNSRIGQIEIDGGDVPQLVPENTEVKFTLSINISQEMTLRADFPTLDFEIEKIMEFKPVEEASQKQLDDLAQEADKLIDRLESSDQPPADLPRLKEKSTSIKKTLEQDGSAEQAFGLLRELILELDLAEAALAWPELVQDINEAFKNLEDMVIECVNNTLDGYQKDQSDLEYLKTSKDSVLDSKNVERGKEVLDKIRDKVWNITDKHAGKEKRIAWIREFNATFGSIEWTNQVQARTAVDRGMQMVNSGASFDQLNQQVQTIVGFMKDRGNTPGRGPGGVGVR